MDAQPTPASAGTPRGGAEVMIDRAEQRDSFLRTVAALFQYRQLLKNLVLKDLKLKYRGSVLGFVWSMLNPLLLIGVYTVAFKYILQTSVEGFVFYLMLGILAWTFFANASMMGAGSIVDNGGLLKSVFFPRAILPTALVFLPLLLVIYRVPPAWPMLLYPVFLILQLLFTIGVVLMLATATAFFRDVRHFLEIGLLALFWLTPVVYQIDQAPGALRHIILLTPMSPYVVAYQTIFFHRQWPDLLVWALAIGYPILTVTAGTLLMLAHEDKFSEQI
jgi:lipopolysaccharide transport system permease protein